MSELFEKLVHKKKDWKKLLGLMEVPASPQKVCDEVCNSRNKEKMTGA